MLNEADLASLAIIEKTYGEATMLRLRTTLNRYNVSGLADRHGMGLVNKHPGSNPSDFDDFSNFIGKKLPGNKYEAIIIDPINLATLMWIK